MPMELPYSLLPSGHTVGKSLPFLTVKFPDTPLFGGNPIVWLLLRGSSLCQQKSRHPYSCSLVAQAQTRGQGMTTWVACWGEQCPRKLMSTVNLWVWPYRKYSRHQYRHPCLGPWTLKVRHRAQCQRTARPGKMMQTLGTSLVLRGHFTFQCRGCGFDPCLGS